MANLKSNAATRMENIFELTRTEDIPNNFEIHRLYNTKEIAAIVRAELRKRFPMFTWSVRSDHSSIDLHITRSPWNKDEDIFKAVAHYAASLLESYNYDNSDIMTDYFDVNFYGTHECSIPKWDMVITEETEELAAIREAFDADLAAFNAAEAERKAREYEEWKRVREAELAEAQRIAEEENQIVDRIIANVEVRDADYFVTKCVSPKFSKTQSVDEYLLAIADEDEETYTQDVHVVREVVMHAEDYDFFSHHLLKDWNFLAGMGGSATDDPRVNSMTDYSLMSEEERESVEWYVENGVAIVVCGKTKALIDPQGYDYARYVYMPSDDTITIGNNIGDENPIDVYDDILCAEAFKRIHAEAIEQASQDGAFDFDKYRDAVEDAVQRSGCRFDKPVIRQVLDEEAKVLLYRVYDHWSGIQATFMRSKLEPGQEITIFKLSDIGGIITIHGKFVGAENGRFAQYNDAVKLVIRPERKRSDYFFWVYGDILIYPGRIELPDDLLYDIHEADGYVTKRSKFMSFDHAQYEMIEDYLGKEINPVVRIRRRK